MGIELTKEVVTDKIEILEDGSLQVRKATYLCENGVRKALIGYHRIAYSPGTDIGTEDERVQVHAKTAWTDDVVKAYQEKSAASAVDAEVSAIKALA